jgi:hypothetical protein
MTALGRGMRFASPTAPAGSGGQAGFIQSLGSPAILSQTVDGLVAGHSYAVSFFAAGRLNKPPDCGVHCGELSFSVLVGASKILDVQPSTTQFQRYTTKPFTAETTSAFIAFSGVAEPGYDRTSFIDLVNVVDLGNVSVSSATTPSAGPGESGRNSTLAGAISGNRPDGLQPGPSQSTKPTIPVRILECEYGKCGGIWTFKGEPSHDPNAAVKLLGYAEWRTKAHSDLEVRRFDSGGVVIFRKDTFGTTTGLTTLYKGNLRGNRIEGEFTREWPGHLSKPETGRWIGAFDRDSAEQSVAGGSELRFDLSGVWARTTISGPSDFQILRFTLRQTGDEVTLAVLGKNSAGADGQIGARSRFTGVFTIDGQSLTPDLCTSERVG